MGSATTFAELIANPESEKVFLAELKLAQLLQSWTKTGGLTNVYQKIIVTKPLIFSAVTMNLSLSSGYAFVTNPSIDLTPYLGRKITIQAGGKSLTGYIKAAGTGETLGNTVNPITNGDFSAWTGDNPDGWTTTASETGTRYVTQNPPGNAQIVFDGTTDFGIKSGTYQNGPVQFGVLNKFSFDVVAYSVTGGFAMRETGNTNILAITSTGTKSGYWTSSYSNPSYSPLPLSFQPVPGTSTGDVTIDNVVFQKVLTPATTGVTIVSTIGGSTYNWESDDGINPNATSFTVIIDPLDIILADNSTEYLLRTFVAVEEDGTAYTAKTSTAEVDATASTFWHDTTNGILYVHASDGGTPDNFIMVGYFWVYFATKGIILDSRYYEPYIADRGIPGISQSTPDIHWGISKISSGSIVFLNGRGYFDQIAKNFIWHNKTAKILLGGDSLAYAEYIALFTGRIVDTNFTSQEFSIELRSNSFDLLRKLPINNFWTSTWASLDSSAEGKPIPIYYGSYSAAQAPVVTCINSAYAANTYQFKICDCTYWPIRDIIQVYVDYGGGAGWQTISHANEDLANATFTINSASFVLGTSRVKVAFEGYHNAGTLIEGAPEIVEDILTKWCGYASSDLNATSFTNSKTVSECVLNVPLETEISALTVIEAICKSDLAFFDEDGSGLLRYRTWTPTVWGTIPVIDSLDILEDQIPDVSDDTSRLFYKVMVGYGYLCEEQTYLYAESSKVESRYKYGKSEILTHDTYLRNSVDAMTLAGRLNFVTRDPSPILTVLLKAVQINKLLGDKIKVTLDRAPCGTAGGFNERIFELIGKDLSCFPLKMTLTGRDLLEFGSNVGFWMAATAPAWAAATAAEREVSGFWSDADGLIDPADPATKNQSLWW